MTQTRSGAVLKAWIRAMEGVAGAAGRTLPGLLDGLAATHGENTALLGEGEQLSYRGLAARANQVARWAAAEGVAGQVVGLLMTNRPDYVAIWLGLTRAGCTVALLNANLAAAGLRHSLMAAVATHLIVADGLGVSLEDIPPGLRVHQHGQGSLAKGHGTGALNGPLPRPEDRALLVYTSGTTGLPKAAIVTHARILEWSTWFAGMMDTQPQDRLYDCLPLYHSTGGIVAVGAMLVTGGSVLIRARFSASRFWDDVADGGCTIMQYIGELCRMLLASPVHSRQAAHRLRLACGNGLAGDIWPAFQTRFGIPHILEFYAATEGTVSLYNVEGKPGAIGRVPGFLQHRFPVALVRCDPETGEPARDAAGLCVPCGPDEPGEALGRIAANRAFDGYTDQAASARKLVRSVLEPGDRWFRTGDLMRKDAAGYYFFLDRLGDTFRWKGENVSTTEVAAVLRACPGVTEAVVFGVAVPGHDGRAGMAAITTDHRFEWASLYAHLARHLPDYARPLFLRRCDALDTTGTFKLAKGGLAAQGYIASPDPVWLRDRAAGRFVPLGPGWTAGGKRL